MSDTTGVTIRDFPAALWRAAKAAAALRGQTLPQFVAEALRAHLDATGHREDER